MVTFFTICLQVTFVLPTFLLPSGIFVKAIRHSFLWVHHQVVTYPNPSHGLMVLLMLRMLAFCSSSGLEIIVIQNILKILRKFLVLKLFCFYPSFLLIFQHANNTDCKSFFLIFHILLYLLYWIFYSVCYVGCCILTGIHGSS